MDLVKLYGFFPGSRIVTVSILLVEFYLFGQENLGGNGPSGDARDEHLLPVRAVQRGECGPSAATRGRHRGPTRQLQLSC